MLVEAVTIKDLGWLDGHEHKVIFPLAASRPPAPSPIRGPMPTLTNRTHGHLPGSPDARWLYAQIHSRPERHTEIIAHHLPELLDALEDPEYWFVRYRSPHQSDHRPVRIQQPERLPRITRLIQPPDIRHEQTRQIPPGISLINHEPGR